MLKTLLIASAFVASGAISASAQSNTAPPNAGAAAGANVSAATHCRNAQGQVQMKTAAQAGGTSANGSATTGAGTRPSEGTATTGTGAAGAGMSGPPARRPICRTAKAFASAMVRCICAPEPAFPGRRAFSALGGSCLFLYRAIRSGARSYCSPATRLRYAPYPDFPYRSAAFMRRARSMKPFR